MGKVVTFAVAEANVAVSIALFGGASAFVSALPKHSIADACVGIFSRASWFHITGITPSLSKNSSDISLKAVQAARRGADLCPQ
jgi:sugar/nucleoside kinase (ribokinase family)